MSKPRSIFEEVSASPSAVPSARRDRPKAARGAIALWLALIFALVVTMIAVGGMTRLTDSGLSIVEWRPVTGAVPPLNDADWQGEFEKYRSSPQFALMNSDMDLEAFRSIYWWEWGHRQLGRLIGLIWAAGFVWFWLRGRIPAGWTPRLLALGALGGLQGAIGWWMVSSGLSASMTSVASYRLAVHLGLAFVILGLITWFVLQLRRTEGDLLQARRQRSDTLMRWASVLVGIAFLQVLLGALVAGIDAGRNFVDWPLMGGSIFPAEALVLEPRWLNFTQNPGLVQFNHRLLGYILAAVGLAAWLRSRKSARTSMRRAFDAAGLMTLVQIGIGVATVLYGAPWQIAIVHQLGAVALFVLLIRARFLALYPATQRIARG